jgi:predicted dehydrogenase
MTKTKTIGVGLVGVGNWGRYGHIPALRLLPEYKIVAVSSRSAERAAQIATEHAIPHHFSNMLDLVIHPEVDLVVALPPAPEHAAVIKAACDAGKAVYCEWPLTPSTSNSKALLALVESAGRRHVVGLQRTCGASSRYLRDVVKRGEIGKLRSVRMQVSVPSFGPSRPPGLAWTLAAHNFSHVLSIYGGHFMHMLFSAVGFPRTVSAVVRTQFPDLTLSATGESFSNESPDGIVVQGTLENDGALFQVQIEGGKTHGSGLQIDITGLEGDLVIRNDKAFATKRDNVLEGATSQHPEWTQLPIPDSYRQIPASALDVSVQDLAHLYAAFALDGRQGTKNAPDFSSAVMLHRLIDAIYCSSASGQSINVRHQQ